MPCQGHGGASDSLPEEGDANQALEGLERVLHQGFMLLALLSEVAIALARYEKGIRKKVDSSIGAPSEEIFTNI